MVVLHIAVAVALKDWETRKQHGQGDAKNETSSEEEEEENIYVKAAVDVSHQ
jgi:hypothetical protein